MGGDSQGIGSLKQLIDAISACDRCELAKYRVKLVPGYGPPNAKIFVVGEAPGLEAESQRKPFVGMYEPVIAGWLDYLELRRKDIYITNAVKCVLRGRNGKVRRDGVGPVGRSLLACRHWLILELRLVKPKIVVTLGWAAIQSLLGVSSIVAFRQQGYWREVNDLFYFTLYHPASGQRGGITKMPDDTKEDLDRLRTLLEQVDC